MQCALRSLLVRSPILIRQYQLRDCQNTVKVVRTTETEVSSTDLCGVYVMTSNDGNTTGFGSRIALRLFCLPELILPDSRNAFLANNHKNISILLKSSDAGLPVGMLHSSSSLRLDASKTPWQVRRQCCLRHAVGYTSTPQLPNQNIFQSNASQDVLTEVPQEPELDTPQQPVEGPVTSVLHPITPHQDALNPDVAFRIQSASAQFDEYEELFPQYGKSEPGRHYRITNTQVLNRLGNRESNSVLIICVFNGDDSLGGNRTIADFFSLIGSFDYPKDKVSIALLTSSMDAFRKVKAFFANYIQHYPRLSVIFRDDFAQGGLTRDNRHEVSRQANRRRMIARYRNYALMSTLETWHQHVLWLDADVEIVPAHLLPKMVHSGLDILMPTCRNRFRGVWINYDQNGWIGTRKIRPADQSDDDTFLPGPLRVKLLDQVDDKSKPFTPMDSVGGTMLYVRADVHRQGVLFPVHYVIGSEWGREGYDGIETEGLCYIAHFLGFKCWGMVNETIQHTEEF